MGDFCKATRRSKALEEIIIFRSMLLMRYSGLSKPGPGEVVRIRTRDPRGIHTQQRVELRRLESMFTAVSVVQPLQCSHLTREKYKMRHAQRDPL